MVKSLNILGKYGSNEEGADKVITLAQVHFKEDPASILLVSISDRYRPDRILLVSISDHYRPDRNPVGPITVQ